MYNNELKENVKKIYRTVLNMDNNIIDIKVAIHNLEKIGINTKELEKIIDNIGIEFYKLKQYNNDYILKLMKQLLNISWFSSNMLINHPLPLKKVEKYGNKGATKESWNKVEQKKTKKITILFHSKPL